ncbi:MAG: LysR family transcriptional regulator [Rhodobacteraceae bacterium]|nr:LysR family transcriptional regulator [Paracoccaceae bacterium]
MNTVNLPMNLLRTLAAVIDLGGYTRAAGALGRTQPAISLQIKRLETLLDTQLIVTSGRQMKLTERGETLIQFARQILRLNDEAVARFSSRPATGVLRVGLPTDYSVSFLQDAMAEFSKQHDGVTLEIHCDLSRYLIEALHQDDLDMAVGLLSQGVNPYLVREWEDTPIWAASPGFVMQENTIVPLVGHPEGCEYRNRMITALTEAGHEWRVAYTSPGISGLQQAVCSGLGVTALTRKTITSNMKILTEQDGFPSMANFRIGMFYKHARLTDAGLMLVGLLIECLDEASNPNRNA